MARGSNSREGRSARSEASNPERGLPKSFESVLNPGGMSAFLHDRADERTYRAYNSTKEEFESWIDSKEMRVVEEQSFTKTAKVKGETIKIERVFNRTIDDLDSQNKGAYGVRETYILTKGEKELRRWYYYGTTA